jgi:hypothetical protein
MSTAAPVDSRLALRSDISVRTVLDGAWWPRSRDPLVEVSNLARALDARYGPLSAVLLNAGGWDTHPSHIQVGGRRIRLGWFGSLEASLLIVDTAAGRRVDLMVVTPTRRPARPARAMDMPSHGAHTLRAADIATAAAGRPDSGT